MRAFGQLVDAKVVEILKKSGADQASQFGGTFEGSGGRALVEKGASIIEEMVECVLQARTRFADSTRWRRARPCFFLLMASSVAFGRNDFT